VDSIYKILESLNKISEATHPEVEKFMDAVVAAGDEGYEMLGDAQLGQYGDAVRDYVENMYANASQEIGGHPDDDQEQILDKMMDYIRADFPAKKATNEGADPDPEIVAKFARVPDSQRSYYVMKWAEENGINSDEAMELAGYEKGSYMGAGAYNWHYVGESIQEGQYDGKSREELLKMKAEAEASIKNMKSSGMDPQSKFYDETQMMMAQQHLKFINDALKKVGESVKEAMEDDYDGASVEDIASAITQRMMKAKNFGALVREIDIIDLNDAIEDVARFHEGGDLGSSDVSNMVRDVLKQLGKQDMKLEDVEVNEAVSLDQAREYFFDKHDFADENIQGEYDKMASKMSSKDAMTLKKELEEFYPEALNEQDVEEGNDFTKARLDAIKAGKDSFKVDGKTYKVTGDTSDEEAMSEDHPEPANPDEEEMSGDQIEYIKYAVDEIKDSVESGNDFPEWFQNKLSGVYSTLKDLHGYMEGDKRNDDVDDVEPPMDESEEKEEVEETTTAGAIATTATGQGLFKNPSVYEDFNNKVESMITESMHVTVNSSNDPAAEPGISVSATGEDAMALAQLLQLAAVPSKPMTKKVCKHCGDEQGKPEHMDCPYDCMDPMGENFMEVACEADEANSADNGVTYDMHYLINSISGGLNGPKRQINPNNPGDNPMAMTGIGKDTLNMSQQVSEGEDVKSHLETLYKEFKSK
jgi:hypothetical protein